MSDKLQSADLDIVTGCERVTDLLSAVQALRCEPKFKEFWEFTLAKCQSMKIEEPRQERAHKLPRRIDDKPDTAVHLTLKDQFRISFFYNVRYIICSVCSIIIFSNYLQLCLFGNLGPRSYGKLDRKSI